ncbi:MAG: ParA family protein [Lachnospiraceae bacterium]|nr:ParA family protein [Lachnospiraceae bacterium]MBP3458883.1 ParA family protein [Lachnospiraceae bacterium]
MKTIVFLNNKGGVGKTASVTTIAHMMAAKYGKKVLLIDLDPQMNSTCMFSHVNFIELFHSIYHGTCINKQKSIEDLLLNRDLDIHKCILHTEYENLDIIPSHLTLSEAAERIKADVKTPQQFRLKGHLKSLQQEYDYCIIDSSPSMSIVNINGLVAADEVYVPLRCDGGSLLGAAIIMNLFQAVSEYNEGLKIGGMFFTQWNGRKNVSKAVYELLEESFGKYMIPVSISTSKNIEESSLVQIPLLAYDDGRNKCKTTMDYLKLTEYILNNSRS